MKTIKTNLIYVTMAISLLAFSHCNSDDEADPCEAFECLNGGEKIAGTDGCQCECPIGKSPNPDNNCACE